MLFSAFKPEHHGLCMVGIWRNLSSLEDACFSFQGQNKKLSSWAGPTGGGLPEQWVFLCFNWNNYRTVEKMMKRHGLNGSFKHLTINSGRGRKVHFLACLHLRLNLWDHWKPSKYLTMSGHICLLHISQLGFGSGLNITCLVINDDLIIKHNEDSMSEKKYSKQEAAWMGRRKADCFCLDDSSELWQVMSFLWTSASPSVTWWSSI